MAAKLPSLPSGWDWVDERSPQELPSPDEANQQVGSVLRQIMGPQKPDPVPPTFMSGVIKPTLEAIPHSPLDVGLDLASFMLSGPGSLAVKAAAKVLPEAVPVLETAGATLARRLAGMAATGGAIGGLPGAAQGIFQQLPGEIISKLSKYGLMNAQASSLAKQDPETLGKIVTPIIPNLGAIKSANDFHAAFNNGGAQLVASQAYRDGMAALEAQVGQQPIRSTLMAQMRGAGATPAPGSVTMVGGIPGAQASMPGAIGVPSAEYSFPDAVHTLQRLRREGWNQDEIRQGLGAMDARAAADTLSKEIQAQIGPSAAKDFAENDGQYARAQSLIDYISDPALLKQNGDLNVPRLQDKFKADGYSQRQSLQMTADAMALKEAIFRGDPSMATDVPSEAGRIFDHLRLHFGIIPTTNMSLPKLGSYAGRQNWGLDPFVGTQVGQLLKRGIKSRPNTLAADSSE